MIRRLLIFWGACAGFFLFIVLPVRFLNPDRSQVDAMTLQALAALLVCLIPTSATLILSIRTSDLKPDMQTLIVLGGTGIRMFFVLLSAFGLYKFVPEFQSPNGYWIWILVFYMFTLALEMVLVLGWRPSPKPLEGSSERTTTTADI